MDPENELNPAAPVSEEAPVALDAASDESAEDASAEEVSSEDAAAE